MKSWYSTFWVILLVGFTGSAFAYKSLSLELGQKSYGLSAHNFEMHSAKNFQLSYLYGLTKNNSWYVSGAVANSNKVIVRGIEYVSASTLLTQEMGNQFSLIQKKKIAYIAGGYIHNMFQLNFFPVLDKDHFRWENITSIGIQQKLMIPVSKNRFLYATLKSSLFSNIIFGRFHRFAEQQDSSPGLQTYTNNGSLGKFIHFETELGWQQPFSKLFISQLYFYNQFQQFEKFQNQSFSVNNTGFGIRCLYL